MNQVRCSEDGITSSYDKTPLPEQGRNEKSCERSRRVVDVPVVVEPVVVRYNLALVPVTIADVEIVVRRVVKMCEAPPVPLPAKRYHT